MDQCPPQTHAWILEKTLEIQMVWNKNATAMNTGRRYKRQFLWVGAAKGILGKVACAGIFRDDKAYYL